MQLHAIWPYFILMATVVGLAATPVFRFIDTSPKVDERYTTIDGLRGFLALSVFVFHLIVTHEFIETGRWEVPSSRFYALLGPVGVSLFFMIRVFCFGENCCARTDARAGASSISGGYSALGLCICLWCSRCFASYLLALGLGLRSQ